MKSNLFCSIGLAPLSFSCSSNHNNAQVLEGENREEGSIKLSMKAPAPQLRGDRIIPWGRASVLWRHEVHQAPKTRVEKGAGRWGGEGGKKSLLLVAKHASSITTVCDREQCCFPLVNHHGSFERDALIKSSLWQTVQGSQHLGHLVGKVFIPQHTHTCAHELEVTKADRYRQAAQPRELMRSQRSGPCFIWPGQCVGKSLARRRLEICTWPCDLPAMTGNGAEQSVEGHFRSALWLVQGHHVTSLWLHPATVGQWEMDSGVAQKPILPNEALAHPPSWLVASYW